YTTYYLLTCTSELYVCVLSASPQLNLVSGLPIHGGDSDEADVVCYGCARVSDYHRDAAGKQVDCSSFGGLGARSEMAPERGAFCPSHPSGFALRATPWQAPALSALRGEGDSSAQRVKHVAKVAGSGAVCECSPAALA